MPQHTALLALKRCVRERDKHNGFIPPPGGDTVTTSPTFMALHDVTCYYVGLCTSIVLCVGVSCVTDG